MSRVEKIAKAQELREQGLTHREIGERLGVHSTTARIWVNPEAAEKKRRSNARSRDRNREARRRYDREYHRRKRIDCPQCGSKMLSDSKLCMACRGDDVDRRARQLEKWWAEGLTLKEIAAKLGWSVSHLSVELHRAREAGYSLPYRRRLSSPRFPRQVAA